MSAVAVLDLLLALAAVVLLGLLLARSARLARLEAELRDLRALLEARAAPHAVPAPRPAAPREEAASTEPAAPAEQEPAFYEAPVLHLASAPPAPDPSPAPPPRPARAHARPGPHAVPPPRAAQGATEQVTIVVHAHETTLAALRAEVPGRQEFPTAIVDESLYLTEVERARARGTPRVGEETLVDAVLLHEPTPHDPNGVAVHLAGFGPVGHLSHPMAQAWGPLLEDYRRKAGAVLVTRAVIRGRDEPGIHLGTDIKAATAALERYVASRELVPA